MIASEAIECLENLIKTIDTREGNRSCYDVFIRKEHYDAIKVLKDLMAVINKIINREDGNYASKTTKK